MTFISNFYNHARYLQFAGIVFLTTPVTATFSGDHPPDSPAPVAVPTSLRLKLLLGPLIGWGVGLLFVAPTLWLRSETSAALPASMLLGLVCLASGLAGQLPLVGWRMFEVEKLASVLLVGMGLRGGLAIVGAVGIIKWGIAESGVVILSFVSWYALILIADLFFMIRYINRFAPTPTANTKILVGGKRSS